MVEGHCTTKSQQTDVPYERIITNITSDSNCTAVNRKLDWGGEGGGGRNDIHVCILYCNTVIVTSFE